MPLVGLRSREKHSVLSWPSRNSVADWPRTDSSYAATIKRSNIYSTWKTLMGELRVGSLCRQNFKRDDAYSDLFSRPFELMMVAESCQQEADFNVIAHNLSNISVTNKTISITPELNSKEKEFVIHMKGCFAVPWMISGSYLIWGCAKASWRAFMVKSDIGTSNRLTSSCKTAYGGPMCDRKWLNLWRAAITVRKPSRWAGKNMRGNFWLMDYSTPVA